MQIYTGDALEVLTTLPNDSVHCCVTSPPYYGLRNYQIDGQIGLEDTPEKYIERLTQIFTEMRRVLRNDGTLWLNLGDTYWSGGGASRHHGYSDAKYKKGRKVDYLEPQAMKHSLFKPKDLVGMPWRIAFALQANGWYLRSDIIWHKPNPLPESVTDRPTKSHEYIFLLSKSGRYFYNQDAIREPLKLQDGDGVRFNIQKPKRAEHGMRYKPERLQEQFYHKIKGANRRTVWSITKKPYREAHFATFPPELPRLCILAGCPEGGTVIDPFNGAGTTGLVARQLGRNYIGIELNPVYVEMSQRRILDNAPLLNIH